ncbi:MAG: hypothetical protein IJA10_15330 [Lachnospiraceae bacterium]|nr:hypothetical protein [Lachnospiraceae bacterium]
MYDDIKDTKRILMPMLKMSRPTYYVADDDQEIIVRLIEIQKKESIS